MHTYISQRLPYALEAQHGLSVDSRLLNAVDVSQDPQHPLPHHGCHHGRPANGTLGLRRGKGGGGGRVAICLFTGAGVLRDGLMVSR